MLKAYLLGYRLFDLANPRLQLPSQAWLERRAARSANQLLDQIKKETQAWLTIQAVNYQLQNEQDTLMNPLTDYYSSDLLPVVEGESLWVFSRSEWSYLREKGLNPYTRKPLSNDTLNLLEILLDLTARGGAGAISDGNLTAEQSGRSFTSNLTQNLPVADVVSLATLEGLVTVRDDCLPAPHSGRLQAGNLTAGANSVSNLINQQEPIPQVSSDTVSDEQLARLLDIELNGSPSVIETVLVQQEPVLQVSPGTMPTEQLTNTVQSPRFNFQTCCYIFTKGARRGEQCGNITKPNSYYCRRCANKRGASLVYPNQP